MQWPLHTRTPICCSCCAYCFTFEADTSCTHFLLVGCEADTSCTRSLLVGCKADLLMNSATLTANAQNTRSRCLCCGERYSPNKLLLIPSRRRTQSVSVPRNTTDESTRYSSAVSTAASFVTLCAIMRVLNSYIENNA